MGHTRSGPLPGARRWQGWLRFWPSAPTPPGSPTRRFGLPSVAYGPRPTTPPCWRPVRLLVRIPLAARGDGFAARGEPGLNVPAAPRLLDIAADGGRTRPGRPRRSRGRKSRNPPPARGASRCCARSPVARRALGGLRYPSRSEGQHGGTHCPHHRPRFRAAVRVRVRLPTRRRRRQGGLPRQPAGRGARRGRVRAGGHGGPDRGQRGRGPGRRQAAEPARDRQGEGPHVPALDGRSARAESVEGVRAETANH